MQDSMQGLCPHSRQRHSQIVAGQLGGGDVDVDVKDVLAISAPDGLAAHRMLGTVWPFLQNKSAQGYPPRTCSVSLKYAGAPVSFTVQKKYAFRRLNSFLFSCTGQVLGPEHFLLLRWSPRVKLICYGAHANHLHPLAAGQALGLVDQLLQDGGEGREANAKALHQRAMHAMSARQRCGMFACGLC